MNETEKKIKSLQAVDFKLTEIENKMLDAMTRILDIRKEIRESIEGLEAKS